MKPFTEAMRYEYPLSPQSVVWDCGGYEGNFAKTIHEKYRCEVEVFEPVFTGKVINALAQFAPAVTVHPYGLGATTRTEKMRIKGDSTGMFADSGEAIDVAIRDISEVLDRHVALLKLNCEGAEFEILEALIAREDAKFFDDIQIQFHPVVPDYHKRYFAIGDALSKTHELTYHAPWCWENWRRK